MNDSFDIKLSNEIPPIQIFNDRGIKSMAYSDFDKTEALSLYFLLFPLLMIQMKHCQSCIICVMILYAILQFMNKKF